MSGKKINRLVMLGAALLLILTGCTTDELQQQLMEVTDAATGQIVRNVTDNELIKELTVNEAIEEWEEVENIPENAQELYQFCSYALVTEQIYLNGRRPFVTSGTEILYRADDVYYIEVYSDGISDVFYTIPDQTGRILEEFAKGESDTLLGKEEIMKQWGAHPEIPVESTENEDEPDDLPYDQYPFQDFEEVNAADLERVSHKQKVQFINESDKKPSKEITDLQEIADFINSQKIDKWKSVKELPQDARLVGEFVFYQQQRKTTKSKFVITDRKALYYSKEGYFVLQPSGRIGGDSDQAGNYYKIPNEAGKAMEEMCPTGRNGD